MLCHNVFTRLVRVGEEANNEGAAAPVSIQIGQVRKGRLVYGLR